MNKDQILALSNELKNGPLAAQFAAYIAKGDCTAIAGLLNKQADIGSYVPAKVYAPPPPGESPAEATFGAGVAVSTEDIGHAIEALKANP